MLIGFENDKSEGSGEPAKPRITRILFFKHQDYQARYMQEILRILKEAEL